MHRTPYLNKDTRIDILSLSVMMLPPFFFFFDKSNNKYQINLSKKQTCLTRKHFENKNIKTFDVSFRFSSLTRVQHTKKYCHTNEMLFISLHTIPFQQKAENMIKQTAEIAVRLQSVCHARSTPGGHSSDEQNDSMSVPTYARQILDPKHAW